MLLWASLANACGVGLASDQGLEDAAAGEAKDVGEHRIELDVGIFQRLLQALRMATAFAHELLAGAQQIPHLLGRLVGHEARPDQPMRHQIGQPGGVVYVRLAPRHVLDMGGVGQHQLKLAVRQNMPDRLPVDARRFHGGMRTTRRRKPVRQGHQLLGRRLEGPDIGRYRAMHHVTNAGYHRVLMHIQTSAMRVQNFHRSSLCAAAWNPRSAKSDRHAPGLSPARGIIWGAQGFRVRLRNGLTRTKK